MVLTVSPATLAALQAARTKGLVIREFVWFKGKNRDTGVTETVGICSEGVAVTIDVIRPNDGAVESRVYQPGAGLMKIPPIPSSMKFEERRLRLTFSRLSPAIISAVKVYEAKGKPVQIHRAYYDPETMRAVDAAHCRFDGFVRTVRIKKARAGDDGMVIVEIVGHSASLKSNPARLSAGFFKRRDGDRGGDHIMATPKIVWGQKSIVHEKKGRGRPRKWL